VQPPFNEARLQELLTDFFNKIGTKQTSARLILMPLSVNIRPVALRAL
jgi:hypothetical protein